MEYLLQYYFPFHLYYLSCYYLLRGKRYYYHVGLALFLGIFFSSITELIQLAIPNRSGDIADVLINLLGYLLGMGIVLLIITIYYHHQNKKDNLIIN